MNVQDICNKQTGKSVLLYSGGMDSYIASKIDRYDTLLYIDSRSRYSAIEREFLKKQNIDNLVIDERLNLSDVEYDSAIVPLRNLHFANIATYYGDTIVLCALSGDRSSDKDHTFASKTEDLLNYIYKKSWWCEGRNIKIDLRYKHLSKKQMIDLYVSKGFSIDDLVTKSFSCYNPIDGKPCSRCKACTRKWISLLPYKDTSYLFNGNPKDAWKTKIEDIRKNINDPILSRGQEDIETIEIWDKYCI